MVSMSRLIAQDVLAAYDFNGAGGLLDVGGGAGALLIARYASSIEQRNFCAGSQPWVTKSLAADKVGESQIAPEAVAPTSSSALTFCANS